MVQEFFIQWHLTERCNLACRHCYQQQTAGPELPAAQITEFLRGIKTTLDDWAAEYGLSFRPALHLTGGEPLLASSFWEITGAAANLGFPPAVLTNGTLVSDGVARRLAQKGVTAVQVSLEGLEKTHDLIRGEGTFQRALAGAGYLVRAGLKVNFNVTLSRLNAAEAENLVRLAGSQGVNHIGFARLVPCGRGEGLGGETLGADELRRIYTRLAALDGREGVAVTINDPLRYLLDKDNTFASSVGNIPLGGCAAGVSGITFLPDGTVMPCRRLDLPIGNLQDSSFREIWVTSPVLEELRNRHAYPGRCGRCRLWSVCRGCRAVSRAQAGGKNGHLADDPQCWL